MQSWSKNLKIGSGVAAVAVLAGVGVLVWALGFRGSSHPTVKPAPVATGTAKWFASSLPAGQTVNVSPQSIPSVQIGGQRFLGRTGAVQPLESVVDPGELVLSQPTAKTGQALRLRLAGGNVPYMPGGGKIQQLETSPLQLLDSIVSPGELLFSQPVAKTGQALRLRLAGANTAAQAGGGGISQLKNLAPLQSVSSLVSPGDVMFSEATLAPGASFTFKPAGANAVVQGGGGIGQLKSGPLQSVSSLVSPGEIILSQEFQSNQPFTPPAKAQSSQLFNLKSLGTRTLNSTAASRYVGILFCGNIVSNRCNPQFHGTMPHSSPQLLVGFVWGGLNPGTKVQIFFIDVNRKKIIGRPTNPYSLPAATGGTILAGLKGPFIRLRLGVGVIVNNRPLSGAAVLNIV